MIEMYDTRVVSIFEDILNPTPKLTPLKAFDLLHLCDRVFPVDGHISDSRILPGACFSNAGIIAFERGYDTVFCFVIGPNKKVYPHAIVRDKGGVYYEISPGNDATASYYVYCLVSRSNYADVLTALGTNVADFLSGPRWFMSLNEHGDLLLPFTHKNRKDRPTVYRKDKFVVDISGSVRNDPIRLRH